MLCGELKHLVNMSSNRKSYEQSKLKFRRIKNLLSLVECTKWPWVTVPTPVLLKSEFLAKDGAQRGSLCQGRDFFLSRP